MFNYILIRVANLSKDIDGDTDNKSLTILEALSFVVPSTSFVVVPSSLAQPGGPLALIVVPSVLGGVLVPPPLPRVGLVGATLSVP